MRVMRIPMPTVLFAFAIAGSACVAEEVKGGVPAEAKVLQPRALGAVWNYRITTYDDGRVASRGVGHEKVVDTIEIEGLKCYRVEIFWDYRTAIQKLAGANGDLMGKEFMWEHVDDKGSHEYYEEENDAKPPKSLSDFSLTLKYPVEKGVRYEVDEDKYEVLDTAAKIKVPAGEFECVVYQIASEDEDDPDFSFRDRYYMSPGVGLVRWEMESRNARGQWMLDERGDLRNYDLKEQAEPNAVERPEEKDAEKAGSEE